MNVSMKDDTADSSKEWKCKWMEDHQKKKKTESSILELNGSIKANNEALQSAINTSAIKKSQKDKNSASTKASK